MGRIPSRVISYALVVSLLSFLLLARGLAQPAWAEKMTTLKVGMIPIGELIPLYMGMEKGYFAEEGLKLKNIPMRSGAVIIPALIGGSVDIGYSAVVNSITARARGLPIMIVASNRIMDRETYVGVLKESGIYRYRDLSGKIVATNVIKGISPLFISELVFRDRGDPSSITWLEVRFPNMIPTLVNKQAVGVLLVEPFATVARENPKIRLLSPYFGLLNYGGPLANWVASEKEIKNNLPVLRRFVNANKKAVDYSSAHPDEARLIVTKYTRIKPAMAKKMGLPNWSNKIDLANLQWIADLVHRRGYIDRRFDVSGLLHELAR